MTCKSLIAACLLAAIVFVGALMYLPAPTPVAAQANPLENRVRVLEASLFTMKQSNDALTKRVSALETTVATKASVLVPTPAPGSAQAPVAATAVSGYEYELVSINDKITDSNTVYDTRSWIMVIKNNTSKTLIFNATIKYFDAQGFVVQQQPQFGLSIGPNATQEYTGQALVKLGPSDTIVKIGVDSNITSRQ